MPEKGTLCYYASCTKWYNVHSTVFLKRSKYCKMRVQTMTMTVHNELQKMAFEIKDVGILKIGFNVETFACNVTLQTYSLLGKVQRTTCLLI